MKYMRYIVMGFVFGLIYAVFVPFLFPALIGIDPIHQIFFWLHFKTGSFGRVFGEEWIAGLWEVLFYGIVWAILVPLIFKVRSKIRGEST